MAVPAGNLFLRGNEVFVFVDLFKKFRPPVVVPDGLGAIFVHKVRVLFDVAKLETVCIEQVGGQPRRVVKGFSKSPSALTQSSTPMPQRFPPSRVRRSPACQAISSSGMW